MCRWRRKLTCEGAAGWLLALCVLAGCTSEQSPRVAQHAPALERAPAALRLPAVADLALDQGQVVFQASWGSAPGQLGRRQEASWPGPMSLAVAASGEILVLDQVNRRVCRYDPEGRLLELIPIRSETTEEICLDGDSLWALVYQPGSSPGYLLEQYLGSKLQRSLPLSKRLRPLTGLFSTRQHGASDLWVEVAHDRQLRVVREGQALAPADQHQAVLGRPLAGAPALRLTARRSSRQRAEVIQVEPGRQATLLFTVQSERPIQALHQLAADSHGRIYLGLELAQDRGPPLHQLEQVQRLMLVRWPAGRQSLVVELAAHLATDRFRDTAVGPDGALYQLQTQAHGATLRRWTLPLDLPAGGAR